jgi:GT2 family glycosyltransferase/glycosyltransferase involved in cell wall biosynthesis
MQENDAHKTDQTARIHRLERDLASMRRLLACKEKDIVDLKRAITAKDDAMQALKRSLSFRIGWTATAPARFLYDLIEKRCYGTRTWLFLKFVHLGLSSPVRMIRHVSLRNIVTLRKALKEEPSLHIFFNLNTLLYTDTPNALTATPPGVYRRPALRKQVPLEKIKRQYLREKHRALNRFLASDDALNFQDARDAPLTVLLVLHNRAELTLACLKALHGHGPSVRLLIVDNASTDQTPALLDRIRGAAVLRNERNEGFLLAANQALERIQTPYVLFLNNDAEAGAGAIQAALDTLETEPDAGAVGGKIVYLDGTLQEAGCIVWNDGSCIGYGRGDDPDKPEYGFKRAVHYCSAVFLMTRTALMKQCGGFDPRYAPAYYEDVDYCFALQQRGYRVVYHPACLVKHVEFGSADSPQTAHALQLARRQTFVEKHRAALQRHPPSSPANILAGRQAPGQALAVLLIEDRVPHTWYGSGFPRANLMVHALVEAGHFVTVYPTASTHPYDQTPVYTDIPAYAEVMSGYDRSAFVAFITSRAGFYDRILISRPHNMTFFNERYADIAQAISNADIIYDAEAVFAMRNVQFARVHGITHSEAAVNDQMEEELRPVEHASKVIAVSPAEAALFRRHGWTDVHVLGYAVDARPTPNPFDRRQDILFVGNLDAETSPNVDSIAWFVHQVLPYVQAFLPDIVLHIVGSVRSRRMQGIQRPGIRFHGMVEDLAAFYNDARLFVIPTRFAAGIPLKAIEAASFGLPIVGTEFIINQLGWEKGVNICGAPYDDPARFAAELTALYTDETLWRHIREHALRTIETVYCRETFVTSLHRIITGDPQAAL